MIYSIFIVGVGLVGCIHLPRSGLRNLSLLLLFHATTLAGATYSLSRYAVPLRPFLSIGAGWIVAAWMGFEHVPRFRSRRRQWVVTVALLLVLLWVWFGDLSLLCDMVTKGGAAHRFLLLGR